MKATQNEVCLHSMAGLSQHHVYMQQSFLFVRPCLFHRAEDQMPLLHFLNSNLIFPKLISLQSLSCEMSSLTIPARDCLTLHYGHLPSFLTQHWEPLLSQTQLPFRDKLGCQVPASFQLTHKMALNAEP